MMHIFCFSPFSDTMYTGLSPLFNEQTEESIDRYEYLIQKYPNKPWEKNNNSNGTSNKSLSKSEMIKQFILFIGNASIHIMWFRVYLLFFHHGFIDIDNSLCTNTLQPRIQHALFISGIELFNSIIGLTKSKPQHVLLFSSVRTGVEFIAAPHLECNSIPHLFTVFCWSLDGIIRFGCFGIDALLLLLGYGSLPWIKSIRYTFGPMLFPLGAGGEMMMVLSIARKTGRWSVYFAASLWPLGFYPLMKTLLKQRRRHFQRLREEKKKKMIKKDE